MTVIERTLRGLFAIVTTLVTRPLASKIIATLIVLLLTVFTFRMHPCSIPILNRVKRTLYVSALWLLVISYLPYATSTETSGFGLFLNDHIALLLLGGWAAIAVVFFVVESVWGAQRVMQRRATLMQRPLVQAQQQAQQQPRRQEEKAVAYQPGRQPEQAASAPQQQPAPDLAADDGEASPPLDRSPGAGRVQTIDLRDNAPTPDHVDVLRKLPAGAAAVGESEEPPMLNHVENRAD